MTAENFKKHLQRLKDIVDGTVTKSPQGQKFLPGIDQKALAKKQIDEIGKGLERGNKKGEKDDERINVFHELFQPVEKEKSKKSK